MRKIMVKEQGCLAAADLVVTARGVTRQYLSSNRGGAAEKCRVRPMGVDGGLWRGSRAAGDGVFRLLYFGTLSSWQGGELGIRALAKVRQEWPAATLTIIGAASSRESGALLGLAAKLELSSSVSVLAPMPQAELAAHVRASSAVLAPLALNDRNLVQGCCPLKILEGMTAGGPVIASDLPVVRELGCDGVHFLLVKPESVDQIAHAALRLAGDRAMAASIAKQARQHVLANYTWDRSGELLMQAYAELGINRSSMA